MSTRPVQKIGIEPNSEPRRASASKSEFGHTAEPRPPRDAGHRRDHQRGDGQLQGGRPRVGAAPTGRFWLDRATEVAASETAHVVQVADEERLVETEVIAQLCHRVGGVLAEHQRERRPQVDGEHDHEHHAEQHGHGEEETAGANASIRRLREP